MELTPEDRILETAILVTETHNHTQGLTRSHSSELLTRRQATGEPQREPRCKGTPGAPRHLALPFIHTGSFPAPTTRPWRTRLTTDRKVRASLESGSPTFGAQLRHSLTLPTFSACASTSTSAIDDLNIARQACYDVVHLITVARHFRSLATAGGGRAQPHAAGDCCGHMEPSLRLPRVLLRSPTSGSSSSSRPIGLQNQDRTRIPRDAAPGLPVPRRLQPQLRLPDADGRRSSLPATKVLNVR